MRPAGNGTRSPEEPNAGFDDCKGSDHSWSHDPKARVGGQAALDAQPRTRTTSPGQPIPDAQPRTRTTSNARPARNGPAPTARHQTRRVAKAPEIRADGVRASGLRSVSGPASVGAIPRRLVDKVPTVSARVRRSRLGKHRPHAGPPRPLTRSAHPRSQVSSDGRSSVAPARFTPRTRPPSPTHRTRRLPTRRPRTRIHIRPPAEPSRPSAASDAKPGGAD